MTEFNSIGFVYCAHSRAANLEIFNQNILLSRYIIQDRIIRQVESFLGNHQGESAIISYTKALIASQKADDMESA